MGRSRRPPTGSRRRHFSGCREAGRAKRGRSRQRAAGGRAGEGGPQGALRRKGRTIAAPRATGAARRTRHPDPQLSGPSAALMVGSVSAPRWVGIPPAPRQAFDAGRRAPNKTEALRRLGFCLGKGLWVLVSIEFRPVVLTKHSGDVTRCVAMKGVPWKVWQWRRCPHSPCHLHLSSEHCAPKSPLQTRRLRL